MWAVGQSVAADSAPKPLPTGAGKPLLIVGSSAMGPMIIDIARQFQLRHPEVDIQVDVQNTARGLAEVMAGRADLGMASRALKATEKGMFAIPIARDGVAIMVHKSNPVKELTRSQLGDILTGRVDNWKSVGGEQRPIDVVNRAEGQGLTELLPGFLQIQYADIKSTQTLNGTAELVDYISAHPGSVTYVSSGVVTEMLQKGLPLKALRLEGVDPGPASIRAGTWPISRTLNLVTLKVPTGVSRAFIQFALSPEAQATIRAHDFIPY